MDELEDGGSVPDMEAGRIVIRVLTSLSEMRSAKADQCGRLRKWRDAMRSCVLAHNGVNRALYIADRRYVSLKILNALF